MNISPPEMNLYKPYNISNFYGASHIMSKISKISHTNLMWRYWQHAWVPKERQIDPEIIATEPLDNRWKIYVARKDEVDSLAKFGYEAKAISLPFAYVHKYFENFDREENSLLFMPTHSVHDTSVNFGPKFIKLLEELVDSEFNKYKRLYVSLHGDEINTKRKFYEKLGFRVILGAVNNDSNSLLRMKYFFQTFEYVVSDALGSHIPYASLCGAKISLLVDKKTSYEFRKNPWLSSKNIHPDFFLLKTWAKEYSFLINSIDESKAHLDWAKKELGYQNILYPKEIKKEFGWNLPGRLSKRTYYFLSQIKQNLTNKQ